MNNMTEVKCLHCGHKFKLPRLTARLYNSGQEVNIFCTRCGKNIHKGVKIF